MDLSSPRPGSVNSKLREEKIVPAVMSGITGVVEALNRVGRNSVFSKNDWSDAYKHLAVTKRDRTVQWFELKGRTRPAKYYTQCRGIKGVVHHTSSVAGSVTVVTE